MARRLAVKDGKDGGGLANAVICIASLVLCVIVVMILEFS